MIHIFILNIILENFLIFYHSVPLRRWLCHRSVPWWARWRWILTDWRFPFCLFTIWVFIRCLWIRIFMRRIMLSTFVIFRSYSYLPTKVNILLGSLSICWVVVTFLLLSLTFLNLGCLKLIFAICRRLLLLIEMLSLNLLTTAVKQLLPSSNCGRILILLLLFSRLITIFVARHWRMAIQTGQITICS